MDSTLLENVYELIGGYCAYVINVSGDKRLSQDMDPLRRNGSEGSYLAVRSANGQHLNYSILEDTMQGLYNVLVGRSCDNEATFGIFHAESGLVGMGKVARHLEALLAPSQTLFIKTTDRNISAPLV